MKLIKAILNILFPTRCIVCGRAGVDFCLDCLGNLGPAERECPKWIYPLYDYRQPSVKKAVWLLKYKGLRNFALIFAEALYGRIMEEVADLAIMENFTQPIVIPVPLSRGRVRERGFNQSALIVKNLEKIDNRQNFLGEYGVLIKPLDTVHQAHVENRTARLKNLKGTFSVKDPDKISGRNIILIDDVVTTGATLTEARKVLLGAGARKVIAFTFAH